MSTLKGEAVLFSEMAPDETFTERFHEWYNKHHIPIRMACDGFASAQRYGRQDGKGFLAVYEMDDINVLSRETYKAVKNKPSDETAWMLANVKGFTRYLAAESSVKPVDRGEADRALDAPLLYAVAFNIPAEAHAEFDAWYETEHVPMLLECKEWLMVRRMRVADGIPEQYTHMALHYLADARALQSPKRDAARNTDWRHRLAKNDWFKASYTLFDRLERFPPD
ncbi:hypothetical protein V1281_006261 [Nitrobacteraceae bacterium AZCC 2161]